MTQPIKTRVTIPGVPSGDEIIRQIAAKSDTALLAFSCGKDSIAAWLAMRPHFKRIIPFYCYSIPGLEFVEKSLRYYEEFFQTRINRLPHPSLYRWLRNLMFQAPENCRICESARLAEFGYSDLVEALIEENGLPAETYYAIGVRAADSPMRRMVIRKNGPIIHRQQKFLPVWDMTKDGLIDLLKTSGVRLPHEYRIFGRSFDGLDYRFLAGVQQHYPADYARILQWFPLAELEIFRTTLGGAA